MTVSTPRSSVGRLLFGVAAAAFGITALIWHDYKDWDTLRSTLNASVGPVFVYAFAIAQMIGGVSILFPRTAKTGAIVLGAAYLAFALLCVPQIFIAPKVYNSWGNFFEQLSLVTGALLVYTRFSAAWTSEAMHRTGRILLGVSVASFGLEQAFYIANTASLVPKWFPPGQMFWAWATTVAFWLAAVALLVNLKTLLATRLLTAMLLIFGVIVWIPLLIANLHDHGTWSETIETFAIAGVAWILADVLNERRLGASL